MDLCHQESSTSCPEKAPAHIYGRDSEDAELGEEAWLNNKGRPNGFELCGALEDRIHQDHFRNAQRSEKYLTTLVRQRHESVRRFLSQPDYLILQLNSSVYFILIHMDEPTLH